MALSSEQVRAEPRVRVESVDVLRSLVMAIVGLCYFPCKWFAGVKQRSKSPWLSYL
jgi:hypothetical protein